MDEQNNLKTMNFDAWGGLEGFLRDTSNGAGGYSTMNLLKRIQPFLGKAVVMTATAVSELPFEIVKENGDVVDKSADWQNEIGGLPSPKKFIYNLASSLCGGKAYVIPEFSDDAQQHLMRLRYVAPHTVLPLITTQGLQWFSRASDYGNAGIYSPITPAPGNPQEPRKNLTPEQIENSIQLFYNGPLNHAKLLDMTISAQQKTEGYDGPMMYFWLPDSDIEIGPAKQYPLGKAIAAAQTLSSMDQTAKLLADRNFVPAQLVSAKGMPSPKDREVTENWLNRFMKGAFETFAKIINSEAVSVVKLGAGMEDLKGSYSEIKKEAREEVGAAFGIPAGIFLSDKAYSQEMDALIRIWYSSGEFILIYRCIEDTFDTQLLERWGYHLRFRPETLDAFQDDEATRMNAFKLWVESRQRPSIGAQLLGMELPEGIEFSELDENFDKPETVLPIAPGFNPGLPPGEAPPKGVQEGEQAPAPAPEKKPMTMTPDMQKDVVLWRQMAQRFYRKGKPLPIDFECKALPEEMAAPIRAKLAAAQDELAIVKAFEITTSDVLVDSEGLFRVAAALEKLADSHD
jgi:hypothetical protein